MASRPTITLRIWNGASYTSFTSFQTMTIERGVSTLQERPNTARLSVVLHDTTGTMDPASGSFLDFGPDVFCYVDITDSTPTARTQFAGYIQTYRVEYPTGEDYAVVSITATGSFLKLEAVTFPTATFSSGGATDVDLLLDNMVAYSLSDGTGLWVLSSDGTGGEQTGPDSTGSALQACQAVAEAVDGVFLEEMWNDRTHPVYRFVSRNRRFGPVQATFTDVDPDPPTTYPYDERAWVSEATNDLIRNKVTVTGPTGSVTVEDAASQTAHGIQEWSLTTWDVDVGQSTARGEAALVAFAEPPVVDVRMLRLEPDAEDDQDLWNFVARLGYEGTNCLRLYHRIEVVRTGPHGTSTRQMVLTGFRHRINSVQNGGWIVELRVVDAEASRDTLILDSATAVGELDTGRLG